MWWFWWSWAERISIADDLDAAATAIIRVLSLPRALLSVRGAVAGRERPRAQSWPQPGPERARITSQPPLPRHQAAESWHCCG